MDRESDQHKKSANMESAQEKLSSAGAPYSEFYDLSPVGFITLSEEGLILEANLMAASLLGGPRETLFGKALTHFIPPKGLDVYHRHHKQLVETGKLQSFELQMQRHAEMTFWVQVLISSANHANGDPVFCIVMGDITDRKQASEVLRESEERFRSLLQSIPSVAVQGYGPEGTTQYWNQASERIYGYSEHEAIGRNLMDLIIPPEMREEVKQAIQYMAETREPIPAAELSLMRKDGSRVSVFSSHTIVQIPDRPPELFCIDIDITARKRAEEALKKAHDELERRVAERTEELRQTNETLRKRIIEQKQTEKALRESEEKLARSKKMESLGLLAGGVAHDLNNVLVGVVSYPDLLLATLPEDSDLREPIEMMRSCGLKAAAIVQDLLTIARGVAIEKHPLNLNHVINSYWNSPEHLKIIQYHSAVTVNIALDPQLLNINGSPLHISKAVMNLVSNACEATENGGNVVISTENRYIDKPLKGYDTINIGEYAVLAISDNGPGILPKDLERIFEPFYSKKVMGRSGTGLGLAVVWNVIQDHNGYIDVVADANGTTFKLYFPATREELWKEDKPLSIDAFRGNGEMILVVDDVESQRSISSKMLEALGYKAKAISSGEGAIEYLEENTVDLMLLDMIMDPGISGRETYEKIIEINPKQKAIIISGFAQTDEIRYAQKLGAGKYIKKPLTLQTLGLAVKEELAK